MEPALAQIDRVLKQIGILRERPSGTIRISADEYAIHSVLWPVLERFLVEYPDIHVDLTTDYGRTDIVRERYDAGVRRGQLISKDMIALRIGPDIPMTVVATPAFLARYTTYQKNRVTTLFCDDRPDQHSIYKEGEKVTISTSSLS